MKIIRKTQLGGKGYSIPVRITYDERTTNAWVSVEVKNIRTLVNHKGLIDLYVDEEEIDRLQTELRVDIPTATIITGDTDDPIMEQPPESQAPDTV
jgi:hypothetical protein